MERENARLENTCTYPWKDTQDPPFLLAHVGAFFGALVGDALTLATHHEFDAQHVCCL